jgi:hypothetical protein
MWVHPSSIDRTPPSDVRWVSRNKKVVGDRDGVIYLGGSMYCIQRGYFPAWVENAKIWEQFVDLIAVKFHHESIVIRRILEPYAWDFIVVVLAEGGAGTLMVVSGCLLEYRNSIDTSKTPYLYIGDLCTRDDHGHRKMATHVCNGVYQLAYLIKTGVVSQDSVLVSNSENGLLGCSNEIYVALMIRQREHDVLENLILQVLYSG